jgi:predicted lipoprotein
MKLRISIIGTVLASVLWLGACVVPAWVNNVESYGETAAVIAESITDLVDPALAPLVTLIANGFTALVNTLNTYKASPTATNLQAVQAAFAAVNANVAQLESAAQIKNQATDAKVAAIVQLLAQAVTEIAAQVPAATAARMAALPTVQGQAQGLKAKDLKREFNKIVKGDPRFKPLK